MRRWRWIGIGVLLLLVLLLVFLLVGRGSPTTGKPSPSSAPLSALLPEVAPEPVAPERVRPAMPPPKPESPPRPAVRVLETRLRLERIVTNEGKLFAELVRTQVTVCEGETAPQRSTAKLVVGAMDIVNGATVARIGADHCVLTLGDRPLRLSIGSEAVLAEAAASSPRPR